MSKAVYRVVRVSAEGKTLGYTSLMTKREAELSARANNDAAMSEDELGPRYCIVQCDTEIDYGETVSPKTGEG